MAKSISFVLVSPPGESSYVSIGYTGYPTAQASNQTRVYDTEKVVIKRDLNSDSFSLVINGDLFITFLESEATAPAHTDANDLHNKLCALFGKNPTVNVSVPNPLPITGTVAISGVTPNPLPISGTVEIIQTGHLYKRFPVLTQVPQSIQIGPTEMFCLKAVNATGTRMFVKLCDSAVAPTVGVTPVLSTFDMPSNGTAYIRYADTPIVAINGLWVYCVRGIADSDATGPATGCICEINYR